MENPVCLENIPFTNEKNRKIIKLLGGRLAELLLNSLKNAKGKAGIPAGFGKRVTFR